jgi:RimJ/RimL family protein N-acetyltransferase
MIGDKGQWRQGHATEVMRLRTDYAFRELGLRKIWTGVWLPNHGSRRALEKTGYRQCGLMHRHHLVDGELRDVWLAEIHREDWARAQETTCSAP